MEEDANSAPRSSVVLDVKPLRVLAPMVPVPYGFTRVSLPAASPNFCNTPFGPFQPSGFSPASPSYASPQPPDDTPTNYDRSPHVGEASNVSSPLQSPSSSTSPSLHSSSYKMGGSETEATNSKKKKPPPPKRRRPSNANEHNVTTMSSSSDSEDPRESVEVILMTFDALRRRIIQLDEANNLNLSRRPDMKSGTIMMNYDLRANKGKMIGSVPGVDVGDIFYFRMEICLVGLHAQIMGGIDYMNTKIDGNEDETMAVSIVSSGGYEDDADVLIYTGQGGKVNEKKQVDDQKLERGNLALERSLCWANEIRVIRGTKDSSVRTGKIYIYDGLYKIYGCWVERGKSGFNLFKYKLLRQPGQPDAFAVWKMTERWKENPSARGGVIVRDMSFGVENLPVCLVNEVDSEKGPGKFSYAKKMKHYARPRLGPTRPLQACACQNGCLPREANCACARRNGGDLPYGSNGLLVSRKPMIYECGASCRCSVNCRNRVTQKGIRLHFEVFKTRDRGWGLRSWEPIRAGAFICEYTGEIIGKAEMVDDGEEEEEDEYIFETSRSDEKAFKWNYGPELIGERSPDCSGKPLKPLPFIVTAKKMGNMSRFMNHSCSPNVFWQPVQHDHGEEGYPHIMFFAFKHIPPMTELTYDYGLTGRKAKKCLCGSRKCCVWFG